jgi:hypothetical protein
MSGQRRAFETMMLLCGECVVRVDQLNSLSAGFDGVYQRGVCVRCVCVRVDRRERPAARKTHKDTDNFVTVGYCPSKHQT